MKYKDNYAEPQMGGGGGSSSYIPMEKIKEYITAVQKQGGKTADGKTYAEEIFNDTFDWITRYDCASLINPQIVENYAQMMGRHIQCEQLLTQTGLLAKHPITGEPIANPLAKLSLEYLNSANRLWTQIFKVIEEKGW